MPPFTGRGFNQAATAGFQQGFGAMLQLAMQKRVEDFQREQQAKSQKFQATEGEKNRGGRLDEINAELMGRGKLQEQQIAGQGKLQRERAQDEEQGYRSKLGLDLRQDEAMTKQRQALAETDPVLRIQREREMRLNETAKSEAEMSKLRLGEQQKRNAPVGEEIAKQFTEALGVRVSPNMTRQDVDLLSEIGAVKDKKQAAGERTDIYKRQVDAQEQSNKDRQTKIFSEVLDRLRDPFDKRSERVRQGLAHAREIAAQKFGTMASSLDPDVAKSGSEGLKRATSAETVLKEDEYVTKYFKDQMTKAAADDPAISLMLKELPNELVERLASHLVQTSKGDEGPTSAPSYDFESESADQRRRKATLDRFGGTGAVDSLLRKKK